MKRPVLFYTRRSSQRPRASRVRVMLTWTIFFTVIFGVVTVWWVDRQLSQPLKAWAELQVRNLGQRATTTAIQEILSSQFDQMEFMYSFTDSTTGATVWRYDWAKLNQISSALTERVLQNLDNMIEESIYVPLGELLGIEILAGTGPLIPVRIIPAGGIRTNLEFSFDTAGINVVRHHIEMVVTLDMRVIAPATGSEIVVVEQFPLDTVILEGVVPEVYLNWGSGSFDDFMRAGLGQMLNQDIGAGIIQPQP